MSIIIIIIIIMPKSVTSPLTPATLTFSAVTEGAAAQAAEERKHASNRTWGGHAFLSQWSLMEAGVRRLVMSSIALLLCLLLAIQA